MIFIKKKRKGFIVLHRGRVILGTVTYFLEVVMRYAGLTDEPKRRKLEHGNPRDFRIMQQFTSETAARQWERRMLAQGYEEDTIGKSWKYGYTFSI